jgi:hypothetical protein
MLTTTEVRKEGDIYVVTHSDGTVDHQTRAEFIRYLEQLYNLEQSTTKEEA